MRKRTKNLQKRVMQVSGTKIGTLALFLCSFADASFLPLPATTFFLLLITLNNSKAAEYTISATMGILSGALITYFIGNYLWYGPAGGNTGLSLYLFDQVPGFSEDIFNKINILYAKWNIWLLFAAVLTPIPYSVFAVFSGMFEINIFVFIFTTLLSHAIKFSFLALTTLKAGEQIRKLTGFAWKPLALITSAFSGMVLFISNTFKNIFQ